MVRGWTSFLPLLVSFAGVASASIFGPDDRVAVGHGRGSPFAPIGVAYDPSSNRYGTAFLVDECHALTAEHITSDGQTDPRGVRVAFGVGQAPNGQFERRTGGTVVASGGFNEKKWNRDADWLLLSLDQCLGREYGYVRLRAGSGGHGDSAFLSAGYPSDPAPIRGLLVVDPGCHLVGEAARLWLNTCAGQPGDSGGPLFQMAQTPHGPRLEVYAIQAAADSRYVANEPDRSDFNPARPFTGLNEAVPVANILPRISKFIRPVAS
ncbi:MAG: trypsin-like serine peptidase [Rhizomicrobium sp.]